jgi:hypothetical protein
MAHTPPLHAAGEHDVRRKQAVQQNKQSFFILNDVKALMM